MALKKNGLLFTSLLAIGFAACSGCFQKGRSIEELAHVQMKSSDDLRFGEEKKVTVPGYSVNEYEAKSDGIEVRLHVIDGVSAEAASELRQQKIFSLETLFDDQRSPYPGAITDTVKRPSHLLPKIMKASDDRQDLTRIQVPMNSRKVLGVAADSEFQFRHLWLLLYCKRARQAVQIDANMPRKSNVNWDKWLDITCSEK